jgi:hypothetical protein
MAAPDLTRIALDDARGERPEGIGGSLRYDVGDAFWCAANLPGVEAAAERVAATARAHGFDVVLSTLPRSRFVLKAYRAPDGCQGWHFDTNGLSALVYLTDNPRDGATRVRLPDGTDHLVHPQAGALLLLQGRALWHRADPVREGVKLLLAINLYPPGDLRRPDNLDETLYGPR